MITLSNAVKIFVSVSAYLTTAQKTAELLGITEEVSIPNVAKTTVCIVLGTVVSKLVVVGVDAVERGVTNTIDKASNKKKEDSTNADTVVSA